MIETSSKDPNVDVHELLPLNEQQHSYDPNSTRPFAVKGHLPHKTLPRYRIGTRKNCLIIFGAFCAYGLCVSGALVPGLTHGFLLYDIENIVGKSRKIGVIYDLCSTAADAFEMDIAFVEMTYKQVKALDAIVNFVFGRGLQGLFSWLTFQVFGMAVLRIVQENPVPLEYLSAMAFDTTSVKAAYSQLITLPHFRTARAKTIGVWLIVSIVFLTAMPTMLDLTTGYTATQNAMINLSNNSSDPNLILFKWELEVAAAQLWDSYNNVSTWNCTLLSKYTNVSNSDCEKYMLTVSGHSVDVATLISDSGHWLLSADNSSSPLSCVPGSGYQYGISSGYCWLVCTCTSIWILGLCVLWFDTMRFGRIWHAGRGFGRYRNILDVAQYVERSLGPNLCAYNHDELEKHIKRLPPVGVEIITDGSNAHIRVSENPGGAYHLSRQGLQFGGLNSIRSTSADWQNGVADDDGVVDGNKPESWT